MCTPHFNKLQSSKHGHGKKLSMSVSDMDRPAYVSFWCLVKKIIIIISYKVNPCMGCGCDMDMKKILEKKEGKIGFLTWAALVSAHRFSLCLSVFGCFHPPSVLW